MGRVTNARPHVVGRRADVSDCGQHDDAFEAFLKGQLRRVRGTFGSALGRIMAARALSRSQALHVGQARILVNEGATVEVRGLDVKGHKGRSRQTGDAEDNR